MNTGLAHTSDQPPSERSEGDPFSTDHLHADLKGRSVRGGAVTVGVEAARFALKFASVPVLARLLTPEDFGLIAMVAAMTGFVTMFQDAGLSAATVQRAEVNHGQISTLFWVNVALSVALMCLTACLAPAIAWFYGEPRLIWITLALAGTFLFGGLTVQHRALLRRQMRFGALGGIRIAAGIVALVVGITAAILGAGYWALVAMTATGAAITAALVWIATGWRPSLPVRRSGVRPMLVFGGCYLGTHLLVYAGRNIDNVLIGWTWGAGAIGIYTKAYSLLMLPLNQVARPLNAVAVPTLSRLQHEPERFRRFFCKGLELIATAAMPLAAFGAVAADSLVLALLGDQWVDSVGVFRALAPAAFIGTLNATIGWLFVTLGRTDKHLRAAWYSTLFVIVAFCVGLRWGPIGVATAYSVAVSVSHLPIILYALSGTPVRGRDFMSAIWRPAVSCAMAAVISTVVVWHLALPVTALFQLLVHGVVFLGSYSFALWLLPGGRASLRDIVILLKTAGIRPGPIE